MKSKSRKDSARCEGYEILLCLTGGIACYKSADLASKLVQMGAGVSVAMTDAACRFIAPLTLQTLTSRRVYTSMWDSTESYDVQHISLTERADLMIVAPATGNIIAKIAVGIADDLVSTLALSAGDACPILIAPAMNTRMYEAPPMQANLNCLKKRGVAVVGPATGRLACGTEGVGRMAEVQEIIDAAMKILGRKKPGNLKR